MEAFTVTPWVIICLIRKKLNVTVKMLYTDLSVLRDNVEKRLGNYEKKRMGYWQRMQELRRCAKRHLSCFTCKKNVTLFEYNN